MPDKRIYMGFIANDQESFFNNIRQRYENHRKQQQQQKQRVKIFFYLLLHYIIWYHYFQTDKDGCFFLDARW